MDLAYLYQKGEGVRRDVNQALRFFKKAAPKGCEKSAYDLECICKEEKGVKEKAS